MTAEEKTKLILRFNGFTIEALQRIIEKRSSGKYSDEEYEVIEGILNGTINPPDGEALIPNKSLNHISKGSEVHLLSNKISSDSHKLYKASHVVYTSLIVMNFLVGIFGLMFSIAVYNKFNDLSVLFACLLITVIVCFNIYINAILSTHFGKVLSNISELLESLNTRNI